MNPLSNGKAPKKNGYSHQFGVPPLPHPRAYWDSKGNLKLPPIELEHILTDDELSERNYDELDGVPLAELM